MAKGKLALDALEALLSGVKRVDIGDVTRPVTGARMEALQKMLPKAAKADDWGWKGGKPGELTGGEYTQALDSVESEALRETKKHFNIPEDVKDYNPYGGEKQRRFYETKRINAMDSYVREADRQLSNLYPSGLDTDETTLAMMSFDSLEKAGIPREWTGRVYKALGEDTHPVDILDRAEDSAQAISDNMRQLTNDQRETFLSLLPEWSGSIDDLAEAARSL
jgi:hypothetical protein